MAGFDGKNTNHKPAITCQQLLGVTLQTLGVTLCFLSQGGGGSIPTRGTAWVHGGTDDTSFARNFRWLNDCIIIISICIVLIVQNKSRSHVFIPTPISWHT